MDINPRVLTPSSVLIPRMRNGARGDVAEPKPSPRGMEALLSQGSLITPSPSMGEPLGTEACFPSFQPSGTDTSLGQETLPCHKALASPSPPTPGHSPPYPPRGSW